MWCDGMVTVVELHVTVRMKRGYGDSRRFMHPIAAFDNEKEAWEKANKLFTPELINLAKELLEEDEEWIYLTGDVDWGELTPHIGEYNIRYDHFNSCIDSIEIGFAKFEVPMNPAEL